MFINEQYKLVKYFYKTNLKKFYLVIINIDRNEILDILRHGN